MTVHDRKKSSHETTRRAFSSSMPDGREFEALYERHADRVFGFLLRLSGSRALAEDLFQQTFLRLAEAGDCSRDDAATRAWLFTVARNAFYDQARARRTAERASYAPPRISSVNVDAGLVLDELERALASLPAPDRELLLLLGVEGLSYEQAAVVLDVDRATLRKRMSRARARLAQRLDGGVELVSNSERTDD